MTKIILLGGNVLNSGFAYVARRMEAQLVVVDWNEKVPWLTDETHVRADIKSPQLLEDLDTSSVSFVYSSADVAATNVAALNRKAGLLSPSLETISNCTNKAFAYDCFERAGVLGRQALRLEVAEFGAQQLSSTEARVREFALANKNCVVKPANNSSSRGVQILKNVTPGALAKMVTDTAREFSDTVIVDKYIGGTEYSIEILVDRHGDVAVWPIGLKCKSNHGTTEAVSVKVIYNPVLDPKFQKNMIEFAIACSKATGVRNSLLHLEVKEEGGRLYPMEIACRSSGFVATHLCDLTANVSYLSAYAAVLRGQPVPKVMPNDKTSVYFFYDFPDGVLRRDLGPQDDPFVASEFRNLFFNPPLFTAGTKISRHANDDSKKAFRVLLGPKQPEIQRTLESFENRFYSEVVGHAATV